MRKDFFKNAYECAKNCDIKTNSYFCSAGYFWLDLTQNQLNKMIDLLIEQGCEPDKDGYVSLSSGMKFKKIEPNKINQS